MFMYYPDNKPWSFYVERLIDEAVQDGADFNECHRTLQHIPDRDGEAWYREWSKTAELMERLAQEAIQKGREVTARAAFFRAFTYYRSAQFWLEYDDARKNEAFSRALSCFHKGNAIGTPAYERVEFPYEETTLPGYFCPAQGLDGGKRPAVLYVGGADTFAEQLLFMGVSRLTERGVSCLTMTGPGQGEVLRFKKIHSRPDYEKPVAAALDYLEKRKEVDSRKMAIMGMSMGGYYAPRGASLDDRVKACLLIGSCFSILDDIYDYFAPLRPSLQHIVGAKDSNEAREILKKFTLEGVIEKMKCPLMVNHGADDFIVSPAAARKTYERARCLKVIKVWDAQEGGAAHCMADNRAQAYALMFDWLVDQLK